MKENFRDDLAIELISAGVSPDTVRVCLSAVDGLSGRYDFSRKETSLATKSDAINYVATRYLANLKISGYSDGTIYNKTKHLQCFFEIVPLDPNKVKPDDIRRFIYLYQKERGVKASSMNKVIESIRAFFAWACVEEFVEKNPCLNVREIKVEKNPPKKILTQDELEGFRECAETAREKALVEVLYSTGARIGEIASLKWDDIAPDMKSAVVFGKGKKYRTVRLNTKARRALKALQAKEGKTSEFVFQKERGSTDSHISTTALRRQLDQLKTRAGISGKVTPHTFRRTMATVMLTNSGDIAAVQKLLGHSSIQTTTLYAQVGQREVEELHSKYIV